MTLLYYEQLAPFYEYIYADWEASVQRQGVLLDNVIRAFFGAGVRTVLDAACGIGTQSIGLAKLGYRVTASDISPQEVTRAQAEAARHGLEIDFAVADMRALWETHQQQFDIVMACDNAVPHLLSDEEISQAFREFHQCTKGGGGVLVSVRDYATLERGERKLHPRQVHDMPDGRLVLFDLWEFKGDQYEMTTYVVEDHGQPTAQTRVIRGGRYYCVTLPTLERLLTEAGFHNVQTLRDVYFQPLLVGHK